MSRERSRSDLVPYVRTCFQGPRGTGTGSRLRGLGCRGKIREREGAKEGEDRTGKGIGGDVRYRQKKS